VLDNLNCFYPSLTFPRKLWAYPIERSNLGWPLMCFLQISKCFSGLKHSSLLQQIAKCCIASARGETGHRKIFGPGHTRESAQMVFFGGGAPRHLFQWHLLWQHFSDCTSKMRSPGVWWSGECFFWFKRVPDQGPEQRESNLTVLCLLIIIILIS
jgi:hypothetical protein